MGALAERLMGDDLVRAANCLDQGRASERGPDRRKATDSATGRMTEALQPLRAMSLRRDGLTDGQHLEDYLRSRDEAALAALLRRHPVRREHQFARTFSTTGGEDGPKQVSDAAPAPRRMDGRMAGVGSAVKNRPPTPQKWAKRRGR
jgi:hypothetical protein